MKKPRGNKQFSVGKVLTLEERNKVKGFGRGHEKIIQCTSRSKKYPRRVCACFRINGHTGPHATWQRIGMEPAFLIDEVWY